MPSRTPKTVKIKIPKQVPVYDLTYEQLLLLYGCPYEHPQVVNKPSSIRVANSLIDLKLLEVDPLSTKGRSMVVRCTDKGMEQLKPLSQDRVTKLCERIEKLWFKGRRRNDVSLYLESSIAKRVLMQRLLIEYAIGGSRTATIALQLCDVM